VESQASYGIWGDHGLIAEDDQGQRHSPQRAAKDQDGLVKAGETDQQREKRDTRAPLSDQNT